MPSAPSPPPMRLTGSSLNIVTILLYAQIRGDVLHNQNLGYALALGMIVITGVSNGAYIWLRGRERTVAAMKQITLRRLDRHRHRRALFPGAADRHLRVLAAHAARRIQFRCLSSRCSPIRASRPSFGYSTLMAVLTIIVSACCWSCRRPIGCSCACRGCGRSSSSSPCCRWSSRPSSSSSAICGSTTAPRCCR